MFGNQAHPFDGLLTALSLEGALLPEKKIALEPCLPKPKSCETHIRVRTRFPPRRLSEAGDHGQMKATVLSPTRTRTHDQIGQK